MSSRTAGLAVSYKVDSSEDEISSEAVMMPTPDSARENAVTGVKRPGRPKASSTTKVASKAPSRASARRITKSSPSGAHNVRPGRRPLRERNNLKDLSDAEDDLDDFDKPPDTKQDLPEQTETLVTTIRPPPRKRAPAGSKISKGQKKEAIEESLTALEVNEIPETQEDMTMPVKRARGEPVAKKESRVTKQEVIPETQPEPMDLDKTDVTIKERELGRHKTSRPASRVEHHAAPVSANHHRSGSLRRKGSTSDIERGAGDSTLRRKLSDLTRKFEALQTKYGNLREVGVQEAGMNFEKLKIKTDEKTRAADDVIACLRADLAAEKASSVETNTLTAQLLTLVKENEDLRAEQKALQSQLQELQTENKVWSVKLAASRSFPSTEVSNKVPGSAAKATNTKQRVVHVGSAEAVREAQQRIMKEELYGDLTGLILRDIKRNEEEGADVYDCIQTGRNGTLHFHLSLPNPAPSTNNPLKTPSNQAPTIPFEEQEFQYAPLLDQDRDRDLIEILPDYLTEEICFPRANAAKFYTRVVDCMTKKIELAEDEE